MNRMKPTNKFGVAIRSWSTQLFLSQIPASPNNNTVLASTNHIKFDELNETESDFEGPGQRSLNRIEYDYINMNQRMKWELPSSQSGFASMNQIVLIVFTTTEINSTNFSRFLADTGVTEQDNDFGINESIQIHRFKRNHN